MTYIFMALGWFCICVILHIIINKLRTILHIGGFSTYVVFLFGFLGYRETLPFVKAFNESLPLTAVLLYWSCTFAYIGFTGAPLMGDPSPTTILLLYLKTGKKTKSQILEHFTQSTAFNKRFITLVNNKLVKKENGFLYLTPNGRFIASVFLLYRKFLRLQDGG